MNEQELRTIFTDEYINKIMNMETIAQVQQSFQQKGLNLSQDEIKKSLPWLAKMILRN